MGYKTQDGYEAYQRDRAKKTKAYRHEMRMQKQKPKKKELGPLEETLAKMYPEDMQELF